MTKYTWRRHKVAVKTKPQPIQLKKRPDQLFEATDNLSTNSVNWRNPTGVVESRPAPMQLKNKRRIDRFDHEDAESENEFETTAKRFCFGCDDGCSVLREFMESVGSNAVVNNDREDESDYEFETMAKRFWFGCDDSYSVVREEVEESVASNKMVKNNREEEEQEQEIESESRDELFQIPSNNVLIH